MRSLTPVILSGGAGTRLWPLSREAAPKPFVSLPDGETLLAKTARRAFALPGVQRVVTVTNRDYYFLTKDAYATLADSQPEAIYLLEPFGRNTAPAIALAALCVDLLGQGDTVLLVLPADHVIRDIPAFKEAVARAGELAAQGRVVTFGIAPTHPETGFGYIECGGAIDDAKGPAAFTAQRFIEKPPLGVARDFVRAGNYLWNSGMFAFTPKAIIGALTRHAPGVLDATRSIAQSLVRQGEHGMLEIDAASFAAVPDISIDYAVMEKAATAGEVAVVRGRFDWSDVGSWRAIAALSDPDADGNRGHGERIAIATRQTFVHSADRLVATVGVENLVIVDTSDALLVAHGDHLGRVKEVVAELKARGHEAYRVHRTVSRPWGTYTVLEEGPRFQIKRIEVRPGAALSLQLHHRRSEHWVIVQGQARVTRGDDVFDLGPNEATYIPIETRHRLENPGTESLTIIEVQCGDYLGEDDIVRFEDKYGRAQTN